MRVLGIDPGLTRCGLGVVEAGPGRPPALVDVGVVRTPAGAEDLEIVRSATLDFYTEAVGHVDPPEADAFSEYLGYEQEVYDWSEANDWNPERSLEDLTESPPPTVLAEALAVVTQVLEDRCDVVAVQE